MASQGFSFTSAGLQWASQVVIFSSNHGKNIQLTDHGTVASRSDAHWDYGLVCSSEPVGVGKMFKVTMINKSSSWRFGGLGVAFVSDTAGLEASMDILRHNCPDPSGFIFVDSNNVAYQNNTLCRLNFSTYHMTAGQSFGILFTRERDLHWFADDEWKGTARVHGFPIDKELWGVVDVCAGCQSVKAEVLSVAGYDRSFEGPLTQLGLIESTQAQPLVHRSVSDQSHQALVHPQEHSDGATVQRSFSEGGLSSSDNQLNQLFHREELIRRQIQEEVRRQAQMFQAQISNERRRVTELEETNAALQRQVQDLSRNVSTQDKADFWKVSPEEVLISQDQILGKGGWGYVAKGMFRGTPVAVKCVHPDILHQTTLERVSREIRTMAQIRHPNLVLFIAAVMNEQTGPMIVTEILETSLRQVYQSNSVGPNKRKIFIDIVSALIYLHHQQEPIIHRDVSTANVLLNALPMNSWLAKLSDFGSANLARYSTTPGEGAIVYTAPEAFPRHPDAHHSPPQTTKIDVYSFGVLACEVITRVFPRSDRLSGLIESVGRKWPQIHNLVSSCTSYSAEGRPTSFDVLTQLRRLDMEP